MSQQYTPPLIFHNFLELHSTLSEKKIFVINVPFFTRSLKLPTLNNGQNQLVWRKFFVDAPLLDFLP